MRTLIIALALLAAAPVATAGIYKHVDKDGRVVFTDQPPSEGAEPVELAPANTLPLKPATGAAGTPAAGAKPAVTAYTQVHIDGPADGTVLRDPVDPVTIAAWAEPGLQPGHRLVILHNGRPANAGGGNTVVIPQIERGTHTFVAEVRDAEDRTVIQSAPRAITVHRASLLSPARRNGSP